MPISYGFGVEEGDRDCAELVWESISMRTGAIAQSCDGTCVECPQPPHALDSCISDVEGILSTAAFAFCDLEARSLHMLQHCPLPILYEHLYDHVHYMITVHFSMHSNSHV